MDPSKFRRLSDYPCLSEFLSLRSLRTTLRLACSACSVGSSPHNSPYFRANISAFRNAWAKSHCEATGICFSLLLYYYSLNSCVSSYLWLLERTYVAVITYKASFMSQHRDGELQLREPNNCPDTPFPETHVEALQFESWVETAAMGIRKSKQRSLCDIPRPKRGCNCVSSIPSAFSRFPRRLK